MLSDVQVVLGVFRSYNPKRKGGNRTDRARKHTRILFFDTSGKLQRRKISRIEGLYWHFFICRCHIHTCEFCGKKFKIYTRNKNVELVKCPFCLN